MTRRSLQWIAVVAFCAFAAAIPAQDHTILFNTSDPGVSRAVTNWGLDTGWASYDNMRRGLTFMGTNNVTLVQVVFEMNAPLTNNDISPAQKSDLANMVNLASMATSATRWNLWPSKRGSPCLQG